MGYIYICMYVYMCVCVCVENLMEKWKIHQSQSFDTWAILWGASSQLGNAEQPTHLTRVSRPQACNWGSNSYNLNRKTTHQKGMHIQVWLQAGWGERDGNCGRFMGRFMGIQWWNLFAVSPGELAIEVAARTKILSNSHQSLPSGNLT